VLGLAARRGVCVGVGGSIFRLPPPLLSALVVSAVFGTSLGPSLFPI